MDLLTSLSIVGILFVCLLLSTAGYVVVLLAYVHAKYDHLPGPKRTSFFLGNISELASSTRRPQDCLVLPDDHTDVKPLPCEKFTEWSHLHGDTYVIFLIHRTIIATRGRNMLKTILVDSDPRDFPKSDFVNSRYLYGQRYMCDGLATAIDHDAWYLRRKVVDPLFHRNKLQLAIESFNSTGDGLITELQKYVESGEVFELSSLLHRSTLDVIMKTMFSIDATDLHTEFHKTTEQFVNESFSAIQFSSVPFIEYNPIFYNHRKATRKLVKSFRDLGAKMISARKSAISNDEVVPHDILTTMVKAHLDASTGYDLEILIDEFVTIIVAGMETSANTLGFVFMELGRRPDLLQRLLTEVDDVVGQKSIVSNDDLTKLSFTTMLIKESLRKYPPAAAIMRHVRRETVIDGIRLPAGSQILPNILGANNDSRYVDNPEQFNPDRFDPEVEKR